MVSGPRLALNLLLPLGLSLLSGCGPAPAEVDRPVERALPLPAGIRVSFNHRDGERYRSPVSSRWREGDNLEALVVEAIGEARQEIRVSGEFCAAQWRPGPGSPGGPGGSDQRH